MPLCSLARVGIGHEVANHLYDRSTSADLQLSTQPLSDKTEHIPIRSKCTRGHQANDTHCRAIHCEVDEAGSGHVQHQAQVEKSRLCQHAQTAT